MKKSMAIAMLLSAAFTLMGWRSGAVINPLQIAVPATATVTNSTASAISGVSISGGAGPVNTVVVNGFGQLQCNAGPSTFGGTLTTIGTKASVNTDLGGLTDDAPSGSNADTLIYNAIDGSGDAATQKTTAVTVN